MSSPRFSSDRKLSITLSLLITLASRADAQRSTDAHLSATATVLASATRIGRAEITTISSRVTAPGEIEVESLVTAASSGESTLSIVPRIEGVAIDILGADGRFTPLGPFGVRFGRTTAGNEFSAPVRLRLRSGSPELLELAARAPVALIVDSAVR